MTPLQIRKLERRKNCGTLYELIADAPGETTVLAGYCRLGKTGILGMLRKHGAEWASRISDTDPIIFGKGGRSCQLGKYRITFSGRTERDAIKEGEKPFFLTVRL